MAAKKPGHLSVVTPADSVPSADSAPPRALVDRLKSDDEHELLLAMRERVATTLADPNTSSRDLAALTRRQMEIAKAISAIESEAAKEAAENAEAGDQPFTAEAL